MALNTDPYLVGRYEFDVYDNIGLDTSPGGANSGSGAVTTIADAARNRVANFANGDGLVDISTDFGLATEHSWTFCAWVNTSRTGFNQTIFTLGEYLSGETVSGGGDSRVFDHIQHINPDGTVTHFYRDTITGITYSSLAEAHASLGTNSYSNGEGLHPIYTIFLDSTGLKCNCFGTEVASASNVPINRWMHIAVAFTSSGVLIYIDGILVVTSLGATIVNEALMLVRRSTIGNAFHGLLDDVRVYSRVLSESEVAALYAYAPTALTSAPDAPIASLDTDWFLVGRYNFDAASNIGLDTSPAGLNSGTVTGNATTAVDDTRNRVLNLGAGGAVAIGTRFASPPSISLCAWVNVPDTGEEQTIVAISDDNGHHISITSTMTARWYAGEETLESVSAVPANTWTHIVFTSRSGAQALYINSELVAQQEISPAISFGDPNSSVIGAKLDDTASCSGYIDDVRVYARVLSAAEVAALYAYAPTALVPIDLIDLSINLAAHYEFDVVDNIGLDSISLRSAAVAGVASSLDSTRGRVADFRNGTLGSSYFHIDSSQISLCAWINVPNIGQEQTIILIGYADKEGVFMNVMSNMSVSAGWNIGSGSIERIDSGSTKVAANTWTHITFTIAGNVQKLYIDGVLVTSQTQLGISSSGIFELALGINTTYTTIFANNFVTYARYLGYMDDVRVYARALSAEEILALYELPLLSLSSILCFASWTRLLLASGKTVRADQVKRGMQLRQLNHKEPLTVTTVITQPTNYVMRFEPKMLHPKQNVPLFVTRHHLVRAADGTYREASEVRGVQAVKTERPITVYHICTEKWGLICAENVWCETAAMSARQAADRRQFMLMHTPPVPTNPAPVRRRQIQCKLSPRLARLAAQWQKHIQSQARQPKHVAVGLDIGTSNCRVCIVRPIEVITFAQDKECTIQHLLECAQSRLAPGESIGAVTVTAHLSQRKQIKRAVRDALKDKCRVRIIAEPVAAVTTYADRLKNVGPNQRVVVFDLGSTLKITLLKATSGGFEVCTSESRSVGDFDMAILDHVCKRMHIQSLDKQARRACEEAKIALSTQTSTTLSINGVSTEVTRDEFARWIRRYLRRASKLMHAVIDSATVSHVIVVGGSSQVPAVRALIAQFFGPEVSVHDDNPIDSIAKGAAMHAFNHLQHKEQPKAVLNSSLGIKLPGNVMHVLLRKDQPLPCSAALPIFPQRRDQATATVHVYQGPHSLTTAAGMACIGTVAVPLAKDKMELVFKVDINGILNVRIVNTVTGQDVSDRSFIYTA